MRGYESITVKATDPTLARYESPCGVMSGSQEVLDYEADELRIPMRGYEGTSNITHPASFKVTNPHAGL